MIYTIKIKGKNIFSKCTEAVDLVSVESEALKIEFKNIHQRKSLLLVMEFQNLNFIQILNNQGKILS